MIRVEACACGLASYRCSVCGGWTHQPPGFDPEDENLVYLACCYDCAVADTWKSVPRSTVDEATLALAAANNEKGSLLYRPIQVQAAYDLIRRSRGTMRDSAN